MREVKRTVQLHIPSSQCYYSLNVHRNQVEHISNKTLQLGHIAHWIDCFSIQKELFHVTYLVMFVD